MTTPAITRWAYAGVLGIVCVIALYALRGVLTPVLVAFALAYLLDPLVDRLEAVGVPRSLGIAVLLVCSLLVLVLGSLLILPAVIRDFAALATELPAAILRLLGRLEPWLEQRGVALPHSAAETLAALRQNLESFAPSAIGMARAGATALLGGTVSAVGAIAAGLVVPVLAFYLLRDFDLMVAAAVALLPASSRKRTVEVGREIDVVLGQFVRGQLTVMAILAALYSIGFSLVSVRLAIPIGLIAGLLSFIPYVGSATALALALLMSALHFGGPVQLAGVIAVYAAVQALEGLVITPRIVGDSLGLSPVWVLIALMVGAELFGFLGVMLALPISAVLKVFLVHALRRYRLSPLYGAEQIVAETPARAPARLRLRPQRAVRRARAVR